MRGSDGHSVGVGEPERAVVEALHVEPALVHQPVVGRAEQDEVVERRLPALGPVLDVMAVQPVSGGAAGEAASAVAARERAAHRGRNAAGASSYAQRLAIRTVHHGDDSGIAAQPPGGLRRDGGAVLDFTAPRASIREDFGSDIDDDFVAVRRKCGSPILTGRLNPILYNLDCMYMYLCATDDGRQQPVHFKLGDATDGRAGCGMGGAVCRDDRDSSVLEYEPPMPPGREGEQAGSGSFHRAPLTPPSSFIILTSST